MLSNISDSVRSEGCSTGVLSTSKALVFREKPVCSVYSLYPINLKRLWGLALVVLVLALFKLSHVPDFSRAGEHSIEQFLELASQAEKYEHYHQAVAYFEIALAEADDSHRAAITERLKYCRAQSRVIDRYNNRSLVPEIISTRADSAAKQLDEVVKFINEQYYVKVNARELISDALIELKAAAENRLVREQFEADADKLNELSGQLTVLRRELSETIGCKLSFSGSLAEVIEPLCEDAGMGSAWPALELGYALADNLDEYSYLLGVNKYNGLLDRMNGSYVGIGVDLICETELPTIFDVVPASPAYQAGLKPGDRIIRIADVAMGNLPASRISKLLTGPARSSVELLLGRGDEEISVEVDRKVIDSPTVRHVQVLKNREAGYFRVSSFDYNTALEMRRALDELEEAGVKTVVIDLRDNGGGLMTAAVQAVGLFVRQGDVVHVQTASDQTTYRVRPNVFGSYNLSVSLLMNKNTASAAEIFAAALRNHNRAILIGETTLGKGVIQTVYPLHESSGAICLTTASYTPPNDESFHKIGLKPDCQVERSGEKVCSVTDYFSLTDPVLRKAVELTDMSRSVHPHTPVEVGKNAGLSKSQG